MKRSYIYILLLILIISCSKDTDVELIVPKERTVLVYVALDNDLSNEMSDLRSSLLEGWNNSDIKNGTLLLFTDTRGGDKPILMEVKKIKGEAVYDTLRTYYDNDNSASPELFQQVIGDTKIVAPAKSYGMLLFSHASGWLPAGAFSNPTDPSKWGPPNANNNPKNSLRSVFEDNDHEMEFADFVEAIPDEMFEFIASEMCFMSSVETAYALRYKTKYLLASALEVLSPGFRPVYETSLDLLYMPKPDLEGFAKAFFNHFSGLQGANQSAAISLVKTSEMEALAELTHEIAPKLSKNEMDRVQIYDRNHKRTKPVPNLFFDFRDYIDQVATSEQMEQLDALLDKAVIFKLHTAKLINIDIERHSGLSVYIPQVILPKLNEAYKDTDWYKATSN